MPVLRITSEQLAIGLVFVVVAALTCLAPAQGDTWWLLRAGHDIWTTGQVPLTETYSHTAAGRYWPNHEWLTEAVFYALHRLGGMPLLALACAVSATTAWALAYSLSRGAFELRLVALLACVTPAAISFALRPQMFTMLCFAAVCVLLARDRLRWVPLVTLAWANLHGAVALGIVAALAVAGATVLVERRWPWPLVWTAAAVVLATLLTPLGTGLWLFWIESPARSDVNDLVEWLPPSLTPALFPFWIIAALLPVAAVWKFRHLDRHAVRLTAIAIGVLPLALQAIRNVPIFLLVALPALTSVLAAGGPVRPTRPSRENLRLNGRLLAGAGVLAVLFVALVWARPPALLGWEPISPGALRAVANCEGPLFNRYVDGGALTWFLPERPVFIDNRQDPYPMALLDASRRAELEGDFRGLFERHAIRCALMPPDSPIADDLSGDSEWAVAFRDPGWVVFARTRGGD